MTPVRITSLGLLSQTLSPNPQDEREKILKSCKAAGRRKLAEEVLNEAELQGEGIHGTPQGPVGLGLGVMDLQFDAPKSAWPLQGVGFRADLDAAEWLATFATPEFGMYTPNPSVAEQLPKMLQGTVDGYRARSRFGRTSFP